MGTKPTKPVEIVAPVKTRNSLIDYAISQMAETGKPNMVAIAQGIQTVNEADPVLRIGMYARRLNDARKAAGGKRHYDGLKPETCMPFVQELSNKIVQLIGQLHSSMGSADDWDAIAGGTGTDAYAETCDLMNIEPLSVENLADVAGTDFDDLNELHSKLRRVMSYFEIERLYVYATDQPDEQDSTLWIPKHRIDNLDEAVTASAKDWEEYKARKDSSDWDAVCKKAA